MTNEFLLEKNKIGISNEISLDSIIKIYKEKIDNMNNNELLKKYFIWDYELFVCVQNIMHTRYGKENRLEPYLTYKDGSVWPNIGNFEEDRIEFYDTCLNATENIAMKIRYLDYLIDYRDKSKKYIYACKLIELLIHNNNIDDYDDAGKCLEYISKLSRAVDISTSFGMKEKIGMLEVSIKNIFSKFLEIKNYRWILEISELFRYLCYNKKNKRITQESINYTIGVLETCKEYYKQEKNMNLHQAFCCEFYNWIKKEDSDKERISKVLLEFGKAYEDEAEYQGGRKEKSYHVRAHFLECAVNHYINIGARDKVYNLKVKIKECYRLGRKETKEHKFEIDIPDYDLIEKDSEKFILESIEKSFGLFSRVGYFTPEKQHIINTAKKRYANSLMNIIGITKITGDRKIFDANGDEERSKYFIYEEYNTWLQIMFSIMYDKVWIKLIKQGLTCNMVVKRITEWEYMNDEDSEIIKRGIERYFEDDFISAIHILTPKFESCFREFFVWGGYATTSIKNSVTQHEQNFNDFIRNDFVKKNIEMDTLFLIQYIMVDNLGYNLRNDVAHGLAGLDKFNRNTANIVIYLFFRLTNLHWEINKNN
ncbi:DUF4209 domain-containing protein [Clostridium oceanicum]|uniref:DUF4209 domain-containing protein n=1 Tax=Clostridium oceanicum TaxID=1543 RepID=A0ABN1JFR8_9CLOT